MFKLDPTGYLRWQPKKQSQTLQELLKEKIWFDFFKNIFWDHKLIIVLLLLRKVS